MFLKIFRKTAISILLSDVTVKDFFRYRFSINIPWDVPGVGDTKYALAFYNIVLPIAYAFDPQLGSAGSNAAQEDPLGH